MFEALPTSFRASPPRARIIISALLCHAVLIGGAITSTASPRVDPPKLARDTIRLDLTLVEEQRELAPSVHTEPRLPSAPSLPSPSPPATRLELPQLSLSGPVSVTSLAVSPQEPRISRKADSLPTLFRSSEVDELPRLLTNPNPEYPDELRRAGVSGSVEIEYVVGTNGLVEPRSIRVLSTDHDRFTSAVFRAFGGVRFKAARKAGQVVAVRVRQIIRFRPERP